MKLKHGCTFQVRTVTLPRGGGTAELETDGVRARGRQQSMGVFSVCRWAEAGLQWVLEGVVQT